MNVFDFLFACIGIVTLYFAVVIIANEFLKKHKKESESFSRSHAEDAMRIKARQYEDKG